jgi:putative flavoprotein involved in K+ transport
VDSLRLFTPARYDGLPGWPFPAAGWSYPTARETADYLEAYAARFELPVRTGLSVDRVTKDGDRFVVECGERRFEAGTWSLRPASTGPRPCPASQTSSTRGSSRCTRASTATPPSFGPGGVLLVGAGNSGADIAIEVSKTHRTWLSGRDKGQVPIRIESRLARFVLPILWFVASHVLTVKTPIGRKASRTCSRTGPADPGEDGRSRGRGRRPGA